MTHRWHIDRFSAGLDELTRRQQADVSTVLSVLGRVKRYSVFEATDNDVIATTMDRVIADKLIKTDNRCGYPWVKCRLTKAGREWLKAHQPIASKGKAKQ